MLFKYPILSISADHIFSKVYVSSVHMDGRLLFMVKKKYICITSGSSIHTMKRSDYYCGFFLLKQIPRLKNNVFRIIGTKDIQ